MLALGGAAAPSELSHHSSVAVGGGTITRTEVAVGLLRGRVGVRVGVRVMVRVGVDVRVRVRPRLPWACAR